MAAALKPAFNGGNGFIIFLDLDGVVADFDAHARACGKLLPDGKPDYEALDHDWWAGIPAFAGAADFYKDLRAAAPVKFLTATPLGAAAHSAKAEWVMAFTGRGKWAVMDVIICPKADKQLIAGPGRILIDDSADNIRAWEEAGGIGIHHRGDFGDTLRRLHAAMTPPAAPANLPRTDISPS